MNSPTRFVILGSQRTGTTLIRTSLASHPDILCHGEAFNLGRKPYKDAGGYWHFSRQSFGRRVRSILRPAANTELFLSQLYESDGFAAIGFKLMLNHCRARPYIWDSLTRRNVRVLLIERRNVLKTLISRRAAQSSGVYHVSRTLRQGSAVASWTPKKVTLDIATLRQDLEAISAEHAAWKSMVGNRLSCLDVVYEEYAADGEAGNAAILDFLNVRPAPLKTDLKKVNPDKLEDIVENFEQVAAELDGTRFAPYLTES